jgi:hypothetical protein
MFPTVHMWLAGQAQSSGPAWLTSPWVALLGLISSVIAVSQGLIATIKWLNHRTDTPSARKRLTVSLGVSIIACVVVLAPFTWETVAAEDGKDGGNPLWVAEIYPAMLFLPLLISVAYYFSTEKFEWKNRLVYLDFFMTTVCLAFPTFLYDLFNKSAWERDAVTVTAGLTFGMLVVTHLAHLLPLAKPAGADAQKHPGAAPEKVT